jgi:hypothetical protein
MRLSSFGAGLGRKAAIGAVETKEMKMRAYSLDELYRLTRSELFALHAKIVADLPALCDADRTVALDTLRKLRRVLAHPANASR